MSIISGLLSKSDPTPAPPTPDMQPMDVVTGRDVPGLTEDQIRAAYDIANSCHHEDHYLHPYCPCCAIFLAFDLSTIHAAKDYTSYAWVELKRALAASDKELRDFQRQTDAINEIKTGQYAAIASKADDLEKRNAQLELHPLEQVLAELPDDCKATAANLAVNGGYVVAQVKAWTVDLVEAGRLERFKDGSANCVRTTNEPPVIAWPTEPKEQEDDDTDPLPAPLAA